MEFPSIPTDSIYKFRAIAGLALILFGLWFLFTEAREVRTYTNQNAENEAVLHVDVEYLERLERLLIPDSLNVKPAAYRELLERTHEVGRQVAIETARRSIAEQSFRNVDRDFWIIGFVLLTGLAEATMGFIQWQRRVQNYQDLMLRLETERMGRTVAPQQSPG